MLSGPGGVEGLEGRGFSALLRGYYAEHHRDIPCCSLEIILFIDDVRISVSVGVFDSPKAVGVILVQTFGKRCPLNERNQIILGFVEKQLVQPLKSFHLPQNCIWLFITCLSIHPSIHLFQSWVTGAAASAGTPRSLFPQTPLFGGFQGVPGPDKRHVLLLHVAHLPVGHT